MALIVAVEGLPGSGKTTVTEMMVADLLALGLKTELADIESAGHAPVLRAIARTYPLGSPVAMFIFWALRLHQHNLILEMLSHTDIIFADCFWSSAVAFDVYGNSVPREIVDWVSKQYIKLQPDITFLFEAPIDVLKRRGKGTKMMGDPEFARRVEKGYQELADKLAWVRVDATLAPAKVKEHCLQVILTKLSKG